MTHETDKSSREESSQTTRRSLLQAGAGAVGALSLLSLSARSAQAAKVAKTAVGYQDSPKGSARCDNCRLFIAPNACTQVDGVISPNGWCRIWSKKAA
jgi:hypothetical protein